MGALTSALLIGATVYSGVRNANEQKRMGRAVQNQANFEAGILDENALYADQQAADAVARGAEDESRFRTDVRRLGGTQRASFAAQGVDIGDGSALDVQEDTSYLGELDALQIRNNARREAMGFEFEASNLRQQGQLVRMGGANTRSAYNSARTGTLLTTGLSSINMGREWWGNYGDDAKRFVRRITRA